MGSCLSGGLDSSSIVCIANQLLKQDNVEHPQKTFSACSIEERFNERKWMEEVEKKLNIEAHYLYPSLQNLFEHLPDITWSQDEPFGSTSIFAQWSVFSAASKDGVKVMLDGQGADEQLAGYHEYFALRFRSLFYSGQWKMLYNEITITQSINNFSWKRVFSLLSSGILPTRFKKLVKRFIGSGQGDRPEWLNMSKSISYQFPSLSTLPDATSIREFSEQQLSRTNLQMLLHWEDRNSMAHSVEARVPFLDYRLVDYVLNLPDEYKISGGITKRILRIAMKNVLPPSICSRMDKMGFVTPEELWVTRDASDLFRSKLDLAIKNSCGLINDNIKDLLEDMISRKAKFDFKIWRVIGFAEWITCFSVKKRLN
jgi:asparagine synthase (glutamine-hydrolysing)